MHLLVKIDTRDSYKKFIHSVTSALAVYLRKLKPNLESVFSLRPYTRIVSWGKDFKNALEYLILNKLEAMGLIQSKRDGKIRNKKIANKNVHWQRTSK